MTIHKFQIFEDSDRTVIPVSPGAKVLAVARQNGELVVWIMLDRSVPQTQHLEFRIIGTGWDLNGCNPGEFAGTVVGVPYVWHIFYTRRDV